MKKKALVFDPHRPYPPQTGTHQSELMVLRALKALGYEVHVFGSTLATDLPWEEQGIEYLQNELGVQVHLYQHDWLDALYLQRQSILRPESWDRYNPPWFLDAFRELFASIGPDLVVIEYAWWGKLASSDAFRSATRMIVSHDSLTLNERMQQALAPHLTSPLDPRRVDPAVLEEDFFGPLERMDLAAGSEEYRIYDQYDGTIAFSDFDKAMIQRYTEHTVVHQIPITYPVTAIDNSYDGAPLLAVSNYSLNIQGYAYFAARVLPLVLREQPDFVLRVAGKTCEKVLPVDGVQLLGYVPDLEALYANSRFAICPVIGGTGMQVKVVEAMAHGVPVIALKNIAASSPIEHGVNGLIANDAWEFARYVVELSRDPGRCRRLGEAARETIGRRYSAEVQAQKWAEAIAAAETARRKRHGVVSAVDGEVAVDAGRSSGRPLQDSAPRPTVRDEDRVSQYVGSRSQPVALAPNSRSVPVDDSPSRANEPIMRGENTPPQSVSSGQTTNAPRSFRKVPKISVITPVLNCAAYIRQCIESVLSQGYENFEHIVVDGGSNDGTVDVLKQYSHLRWISEPDRGEAHALNKGLKMASGDIVGWLNADDYYTEGALGAVAGVLDWGAGTHVVYGKVVLLGEQDHPIGVRVPTPELTLQRLLRWHRPLHLFQPAIFYSRDLLREVGDFREDLVYAVDLDYWVRIAQQGHVFHYMDRTFAKMRLLRADGKSVTPYVEKDRDWLAACLPALENLSPAERTYFWKDYYLHRIVNPQLYADVPLPTPAERESALGLALAVIDVGAYGDGLEYLASAIELYPDCQELYWLLGEARNNVGKTEQVEETFAAAEEVRARQEQQIMTLDRPVQGVPHTGLAATGPAPVAPRRITPVGKSEEVGSPPFGFNVIGYVSGNLGIGVSARNVLRALLENGYPVAVLDVDPGWGRGKYNLSFEQYTVGSIEDLPYPVDLFVFPLADLAGFRAANPGVLQKDQRLQACWCAWELAALPKGWSEALQSMDVLVAMSDFIRHAFAFGLSRVRTLTAAQPLYLPQGVAPARRRFGLPKDGVLFITSFDPSSDPQRKNPFAAIEAFERALGDDAGAHLVVKLSDVRIGGQPHPLIAQLQTRCGSHPRMHLLTETLSYADVLSLYAGCDVFVSLHRAEGLGLGLMEAMALGKPVIATAWSGNMSFMDHSNACPVGYRLVPVAGSINAYSSERVGPDALWAEPDIEEAAAWMRRLVDQPGLRRSIGEKAARAMEGYQHRARQTGFADELRSIWEQQRFVCDGKSASTGSAQGIASPQPDEEYSRWIASHALRESDGQILAERISGAGKAQPSIHLVVLLQPGQEGLLADTLDSLGTQLYKGWGLTVVADTPCPDPAFEQLEMLEWVQREDGAAAALNQAVQETAADWVALVTAGDRLEPQALFSCVNYANLHPDWRLIYTDDDLHTGDGARVEPRFKPDCNPELLRSMPYMDGLCLVRREALFELGGFVQFPGVENYDLCLQILDRYGEQAVGHIADVLCHRFRSSVQAQLADQVLENGRQALCRHLDRNGIPAQVDRGLLPGSYMIDYHHEERPLVSILIPTRDRRDLLEPCLDSLLEKTSYPNYEVIVVDNQTTDADTLGYLERIAGEEERVSVLKYEKAFNFAAINNFAAKRAQGEFLLLLNNDTRIVQPNWLERMLAHGQRREVGVVGVRLVYPDQSLQHAGVVLGMGVNGVAEHPFLGLSMAAPGYMGRAQVAQNLSAVTAACMLVRKSVYLEAGGMDTKRLKVLYNDVDLCLKVGELGYKIVWTPYATVVHQQTASLDAEQDAVDTARAKKEVAVMLDRWLPRLAADPAYNRNLSLIRKDCRPDVEVGAPWDVNFHERQRVVGFAFGSDGSWRYRVCQPLGALEMEARAQCMLMPKYKDRVRVPSVAELARVQPDVLLLHNTVHDLHLEAIKNYRRFNKPFMVFSQDDLMFALPAKNPFSKKVYKDMKKRLRTCLSQCDRLIVTTETLAEAYRGMIDDIQVVPNYLERARWEKLTTRHRQGSKPRIGWAGAPQHQGDLEIIIEAVKETAGEAEWVFFGMCPEEIRPYITEFHPLVAFDDYPEKLAGLNLDLAVAPLEHNRFNAAKSRLKLLEYGVLGIPVVCSDIAAYRGAPVACIANNTRAWASVLRERIHDLDAAAVEGERLQRWVLDNCMLEDHLQTWLDALTPDGAAGLSKAVGGAE